MLAIQVTTAPQGVVLVVVDTAPITGAFHALDQLKRPDPVTVVATSSTVDGVTSYRAVSVVAGTPPTTTTQPNERRTKRDRTTTTKAAAR